MAQMTKSGKVRLMASVDPPVADQITAMAADLGVSVAHLLGVLLTIAVETGGATFAAFADDLARLQGKAEKTK